jgi:predicted NAD/FAD-dependent oxidoreductase
MTISRRGFLGTSLAALFFSGCSASSSSEEVATASAGVSTARGKHIAVIGAGIAGLSAATALVKRGAKVTILESESEVGGRIKSIPVPGTSAMQDVGAQYFNALYSTIAGLRADLRAGGAGSELDLCELSTTTLLLKDGRPQVFDAAQPEGLIDMGVLSFFEAFEVKSAYDRAVERATSNPTWTRRANRLWDWTHVGDRVGEDAAAWFLDNYGSAGANYLGIPSIEALFFHAAEETSIAYAYWILANAAFGSPFQTMQGHTAALPKAMAAALVRAQATLRLGTTVDQVQSRASDVLIKIGRETLTADAAIITTPSPVTRKIFSNPTRKQGPILQNDYASTFVVNLTYDHALYPDLFDGSPAPYAGNIPRPEAERLGIESIVSFSLEAGKFGGSLPPGRKEVAGIHLHDRAAKRLFGESDEAVANLSRRELARVLGPAAERATSMHVQRWENAIPYTRPGRVEDVGEHWAAMLAHRNDESRVFLAGDQTTFGTMEAAAESGEDTVDAIERFFS